MKKFETLHISVIGAAFSAIIFLSSCTGADSSSSVPNIDTKTVTNPTSAVTTVSEVPTQTTTVTSPVTTTTSLTTTTTSAPKKNGSPLSEEQLAEIAAQQKQQLEALSLCNKTRYLLQMNSKQLFVTLFNQEAAHLTGNQITAKITAAEDSYYNKNRFAFADRTIVSIDDLEVKPAKNSSGLDGVKEYSMTFVANTGDARIDMHGTVLDIYGNLLSVSEVSEGMVP